jgi:hypothetical protein
LSRCVSSRLSFCHGGPSWFCAAQHALYKRSRGGRIIDTDHFGHCA